MLCQRESRHRPAGQAPAETKAQAELLSHRGGQRGPQSKREQKIPAQTNDPKGADMGVFQNFLPPRRCAMAGQGIHRVTIAVQMDAPCHRRREQTEHGPSQKVRHAPPLTELPPQPAQSTDHPSHQREGTQRIPHIPFFPGNLGHGKRGEHGKCHRHGFQDSPHPSVPFQTQGIPQTNSTTRSARRARVRLAHARSLK